MEVSVNEPSLTINYATPSAHGKRCGIDLRPNQYVSGERDAKNLAASLKVEEGFEASVHELTAEVVGNSLRYEFTADGDYMTLVKISSRDESTLADTIQKDFSRFTTPNPEVARVISIRIQCH